MPIDLRGLRPFGGAESARRVIGFDVSVRSIVGEDVNGDRESSESGWIVMVSESNSRHVHCGSPEHACEATGLVTVIPTASDRHDAASAPFAAEGTAPEGDGAAGGSAGADAGVPVGMASPAAVGSPVEPVAGADALPDPSQAFDDDARGSGAGVQPPPNGFTMSRNTRATATPGTATSSATSGPEPRRRTGGNGRRLPGRAPAALSGGGGAAPGAPAASTARADLADGSALAARSAAMGSRPSGSTVRRGRLTGPRSRSGCQPGVPGRPDQTHREQAGDDRAAGGGAVRPPSTLRRRTVSCANSWREVLVIPQTPSTARQPPGGSGMRRRPTARLNARATAASPRRRSSRSVVAVFASSAPSRSSAPSTSPSSRRSRLGRSSSPFLSGFCIRSEAMALFDAMVDREKVGPALLARADRRGRKDGPLSRLIPGLDRRGLVPVRDRGRGARGISRTRTGGGWCRMPAAISDPTSGGGHEAGGEGASAEMDLDAPPGGAHAAPRRGEVAGRLRRAATPAPWAAAPG